MGEEPVSVVPKVSVIAPEDRPSLLAHFNLESIIPAGSVRESVARLERLFKGRAPKSGDVEDLYWELNHSGAKIDYSAYRAYWGLNGH